MWVLAIFIVTILASKFSAEFLQQGDPLDQRDVYWSDTRAPLVNKVVNMTDVVYRCLLRFQRCMREPDNPYGVSLLDPLTFTMEHLVNRQTIQLTGSINGSVTDLSQFNVSYLLVAMATKSAMMWANLPLLSLSGTYNVSGTAAGVLPIYGAGQYSAEMKNTSLIITTRLNEGASSNNVTMPNFNVKFKPADVQVTLGGFLGGGPLGQLLEEFLQDTILQFIERARRLITDNLRSITTTSVNARITGYNVSDVIDFLMYFGNKTDKC